MVGILTMNDHIKLNAGKDNPESHDLNIDCASKRQLVRLPSIFTFQLKQSRLEISNSKLPMTLRKSILQ